MKNNINNLSFLSCVVAMFFSTATIAQQPKERVSPAATVSSEVAGSYITINYSQPSVKERKIWGELVPYDKVWRTGANEATTFETTKDIKIEGVLLPAGKYALFTIPGEKEWVIIFNKTWNQWGSGKYDQTQDQIRVKVKAGKSSEFNEKLTFAFAKNKTVFKWENLETGFKISE